MTEQSSTPIDPSMKRTIITGVAVCALLAVAVAVAAVRSEPKAPKAPSKAQATSVEQSASVVGTLPAAIGTITAEASAPAPAATTSPSKSKASGNKNANVGPKPSSPKAPAADGAALTSLTAPPVKTLGMIKLPEGFTSAKYEVEFRPYGWGPSGSGGMRLIAQITKSKPLDAAAVALKRDFADMNATLWVSQQMGKDIALGGTYSGTMTIRPQSNGLGVLFLMTAAAK